MYHGFDGKVRLLPELFIKEPLIAVATLNIVFDESGKRGSSETVVFAGMYAMETRWRQMQIRWFAELAREGVTFWRSVNAAGVDKQFKHFRKRRKDLEALTLRLTQIACDFASGGVVNAVSVSDFENLSEKKKEYYKDPWYCAFEAGIKNLVSMEGIESSDLFNFICDDSEEYSSECLKVYRKLRRKDTILAERIGGLCFLDDRKYAPLQVADLFAYCHRKQRVGKLQGVWAQAMELFDQTFSLQEAGPDIIV